MIIVRMCIEFLISMSFFFFQRILYIIFIGLIYYWNIRFFYRIRKDFVVKQGKLLGISYKYFEP